MATGPLPKILRVPAWWPWVLLVFFTGYYIWLDSQRFAVFNSDFLSFSARVAAIGNAPWQEVLVNGLYPLGYPFLLKALSYAVPNYWQAALVVSVVSAVASLVFFYLLIRPYLPVYLQVIALVMLGINPSFATWLTIEGTDSPSMTCTLAGMYMFCAGPLSGKRVFYTGLLFGLGYLFRYTSLILLAGTSVALALHYYRRPLQALAQVGMLVAGFCLAAAPQWLASLVFYGNPLYNTQHWNVWYALFGKNKFWRLLAYGTKFNNTYEVIEVAGWPLFLRNYAANIYRIVVVNFFSIPGHFLWVLGIVFAFYRRNFLGMYAAVLIAAFTGVVSIAFLSDRIAITLLPLELILLMLLVQELQNYLSLYTRYLVPLGGIAVLIYSTAAIKKTLLYMSPPPLPNAVTHSKALHHAGMRSTKEVLSLGFDYYDLESNECRQYSTPWKGSNIPIQSEDEIVWMIAHGNYRFLLTPERSLNELNGLNPWYQTRNFSCWFTTLYYALYREEVYQVPQGFSQRFRPATQADWLVFTGGGKLGATWGAHQAMWQENIPHPKALQTWDVPLMLSAWRRYKGAHYLL